MLSDGACNVFPQGTVYINPTFGYRSALEILPRLAETDGNNGIVSKSLILILILGISISILSIGIDWGLF